MLSINEKLKYYQNQDLTKGSVIHHQSKRIQKENFSINGWKIILQVIQIESLDRIS